MALRWIIRGLALALMTLCVVAWVGSYRRGIAVQYHSDYQGSVCLNYGRIGFYEDRMAKVSPPYEWSFFCGVVPNVWVFWDDAAKYHGFGFCFMNKDGFACFGSVPLWFPALLSSVFLCLVWRKTRAKHNGKGFPIEPTAKVIR